MRISSELAHQVIPYFRCPQCFQESTLLKWRDHPSHALHCEECGTAFPVENGIINFIPEFQMSTGLAQRAMENDVVSKIYERYFRPLVTRLGSSITYEEEETWLSNLPSAIPVNRILDLACGTGKYSRFLYDQYQPDWVFSVDISMPMLQQAQHSATAQGLSHIVHIRADAGALPFRLGMIDRANCFGALHLFPDAEKTLSEISRISSDGAIFSCLTARQIEETLPGILQQIFSQTTAFRFFEESDLKTALASRGFSQIELFQYQMVLLFHCQKNHSNN